MEANGHGNSDLMRYEIEQCGDKFKVIDLETGKAVGTFHTFSLANSRLESLGESVPTRYFANKEGLSANDGAPVAAAPAGGGGGGARFTEAHFSQPVNKFGVGARRKKKRKPVMNTAPNEAFTVIANEAGYAPDASTGLTRVQLAPYGNFPHSGGMQVFNREDAQAIVNEWQGLNKAANPAKWMGLPWYIGHPDHPQFKDTYKDKAAYGRIKSMEAGADGLYANVRFNEAGKKLINDEMFHGHSVNWKVRQVGNTWRPFSLKSVGFTNEPNIPVTPVLHANEAVEQEQDAANDGTTEGALKGWETRRASGAVDSELAKEHKFAADMASSAARRKQEYGKPKESAEFKMLGEAHRYSQYAYESGDPDTHKDAASKHQKIAEFYTITSGTHRAAPYEFSAKQHASFEKQAPAKDSAAVTGSKSKSAMDLTDKAWKSTGHANDKGGLDRHAAAEKLHEAAALSHSEAIDEVISEKKEGWQNQARTHKQKNYDHRMQAWDHMEAQHAIKRNMREKANEIADLTQKLAVLVKSDARFQIDGTPNEDVIMPNETPCVTDVVAPEPGSDRWAVVCQCANGEYYAQAFTLANGEPELCEGDPRKVKRATSLANAFPPKKPAVPAPDTEPVEGEGTEEPDDAEVQAAADGGEIAKTEASDEDEEAAETPEEQAEEDATGGEEAEEAVEGEDGEPAEFGTCPDCGETDPEGTEENEGMVQCGACGAIEPAEQWQASPDGAMGLEGEPPGTGKEAGQVSHDAHTASAAALAGKDNQLHDAAAQGHFAAAQAHRAEGNNAHAQLHELMGKWHQNYAEKDRLQRQSPMTPGEQPGQPGAGTPMPPKPPQGQQRPGQAPQRPGTPPVAQRPGQPAKAPQQGAQPQKPAFGGQQAKPGMKAQFGQKAGPPQFQQKPGTPPAPKKGVPPQFQKRSAANEKPSTEGNDVKLNELAAAVKLPESANEAEIMAKVVELANAGVPPVTATGAAVPTGDAAKNAEAEPKTAEQPKPPGPQAVEDWQAKYTSTMKELANCNDSLKGLTTKTTANEEQLQTCAQRRHALEGEITGLRAELAVANEKLMTIANERASLTPKIVERAVKLGIVMLCDKSKLETDLANSFDGAVSALLLRDPALKTTSMANSSNVGTRNANLQSAQAGDRTMQIASAVKAEEMAMANEGLPADYDTAWKRAKTKNPALWESDKAPE